MLDIQQELEKYKILDSEGDPVYDSYQMDQIQGGLKSGVNVSIFANPKYHWRQMQEIREGLEAGLDVSQYTTLDAEGKLIYNWDQMHQLQIGLKAGVDISIYANPEYEWNQMRLIRRGLEAGYLTLKDILGSKEDENMSL